jgi:hypothetical protein
MVDHSILAIGGALVVRFMRYKGRYPAKDFLDSMPTKDRARLIALAKRMAETGSLPVPAHGHQLRGNYSDLFEFKPGDSRVFGFFHNSNLYLTSGAPKKKPKAQEGDYLEALNMRADFYRREARKLKKQQR